MGGLLHLVQRGGTWAGCPVPPRPLIAVPNVTAHPSTASVPITVLLYDGALLCGFNVAIKGLIHLVRGISCLCVAMLLQNTICCRVVSEMTYTTCMCPNSLALSLAFCR